jgi:BlaI family penicillinase repressor
VKIFERIESRIISTKISENKIKLDVRGLQLYTVITNVVLINGGDKMSDITIKITSSEWKVMKVIWAADKPLTIGEIAKALAGESKWSKRTIQTLVQRLTKKGALSYEEYRYYHYYALVTEDMCLKNEMTSLLKHIFHSSPAKLVATLVETEDISHDDIDEIVHLLEDIKRKKDHES